MTDQVLTDPVSAEGVSQRVDGSDTWILRGCSVQLPRAALTAIVGPSGAGKTSLMYCLSGLDRPISGRVLLDGTEVYGLGRERRARFLNRPGSRGGSVTWNQPRPGRVFQDSARA